jgi:hypothetical protein
MRKIKLFMLLCFCASSLSIHAQNEKFKALYMYNFTKYIEWPGSQKNGDFIIGILGNSSITTELRVIAEKKTVGSQPIVVKVYNTVDQIDHCHILFIPSGKSALISAVIAKTAGKNTLIICEKNGMATQGAGINYVMDGDKLKYEISKNNIKRNGLLVNSSLLTLGVVVD